MKTKKLISEIMTADVVFLQESDSLAQLEEVMKAFRFRHMPVVDDGRLVGIVTLKDVLRTSASTLLPNRSDQNEYVIGHFVVRDIMTKDVATVRPDTRIADAGRLMRQKSLGCLPVTEADGTIVGIVTEADFVDLATRLLENA